MRWVFRESRARGVDRLVLLSIADSANDAGFEAWPSLTTIAEKAGVDRRTVSRSLARLVDLGELERVTHGGRQGVGGASNSYRVLMPDRGQSAPSDSPPLGAESPEVGAESPPSRGRESHYPSRTTQNPPSRRRAPEGADRFEEFWSVYPRRIGKKAAHAKWLTSLRDTTADDIIDGARRYAASVKGKDQQYIAHPTTWLNQGRWDDQLTEQGRDEDATPGWMRRRRTS